MSSQANIAPENGPEKGFAKYITRMKTVLKRGGSKKPSTTQSQTVVASPVEPSAPAAPAPPPEAQVESLIQPLVVAPIEPPISSAEDQQTIIILRSQLDADRARRLGERFNMSIQLNDWKNSRPEKELIRVQKPILMRVHRTCHRCNTTFGASKICNCGHNRCSSCPRYPPKKDKNMAQNDHAHTPAPSNNIIEVDHGHNARQPVVLTIPSRTGGQPLVRKRIMQRVRRTCHECNTLFQCDSKLCPNCNHQRCVDCPRDPPNKKHYPDGYPGDAPSSTSTSPVKYNCHKCNKTYPPVPHPKSPEGLALGGEIEPLECTRCSHQRCRECARAPPRKVEPSPDPEVLRSLEAKLADLRFTMAPSQT